MHPGIQKIITKAIGSYINFLALVAPKKAAVKAFELFSRPRKGKIGTHHEAFLNPARKEKVTLDRLKLQVYIWPGSSNKTVLLVHGWESHSHRYKSLIEKFQEQKYTVLAFDAPGHGYSEGQNLYVPLYHDAMEVMKSKYKPDYIIGHSIGGMTAIYNQYKNPDPKVQRLVILGAPDKLEDLLRGYQKLLGLSTKSMKSLDNYLEERFGFIQSDFSSSEFAKRINIPGLIIHDKADTITPAYGSEEIHKNWENSALILTRGLNHSLYNKKIDELILNFLEGAEISSETLILEKE